MQLPEIFLPLATESILEGARSMIGGRLPRMVVDGDGATAAGSDAGAGQWGVAADLDADCA